MAEINRISSFKSFTEIRKQENANKLREENNAKRQESVAKLATILDEMGLTSFEGLEEEQKQQIISKIFGDVSEEEIAEIEVEVEEEVEETEEQVSEALDIKYKRDAKKVVTQFKKIFAELGSLTSDKGTYLGAIKYLYNEALTDANFHSARSATEKIIKGRLASISVSPESLGKHAIIVGAKNIMKILDNYYSRISNAAGWSGPGIAEGTAMYLESIGEGSTAEKLLAGFNAANESVEYHLSEEEISLKESKLNEEVSIVLNEGTRGQFGKIDRKGNITSVYTHYDSYPENMLPIIKATFKGGKNVDDVIAKGANSGLEKDINKINFYNDNSPAMTGSVKKIEDYIKNANYEGGAEYIYLWDEKSKKWMMIDIYAETGLVPAFESVVAEASLSGIEFGNDDDIHPTKFKPLVQSLKKNKVKMEVETEEGVNGWPEVKLSGKRKDIEKVLADIWGPDSVEDYEDYFESVSTTLFEATVEMDAIDPDNKDFLKFLKKNRVKIINKVMDGPAGGHPVITMQGKRKDLEKVLADSELGWDDPDLAEYIEESNSKK